MTEKVRETSSSSRRGSRTRYDRSERTFLFIAFGVLGAVALAFIAFLIVTRIMESNPSRAFNTPPRNLDIWSVYPDGRVRFATLTYPDDASLGEGGDETVNAAGPLVRSEGDIRSRAVIGGTEDSMDVLPGPGGDTNLVYPLFSLTRERSGEPYGVDVMTANSPYITEGALALENAEEGLQILSLGIGTPGLEKQIIVAVAFPRGTEVTVQSDDPDVPGDEGNVGNYRKVNIGGWTVYYFDTTTADASQAIRIHYIPKDTVPDDLDLFAVDKRR